MEKILWEVTFLASPEALRHCKKCGARTAHRSSGAFRVNAQQKTLDIWLIYRCVHCETSWNSALYSRVNPNSIAKNLLDHFTNNDAALARQCAMDVDLLKRNGAEVKMPPYTITGSPVDSRQDTRVQITSQYPLRMAAAKIVREKLALSRKAFDERVSRGVIRLESGADIYKCRINRELIVLVDALDADEAEKRG